MLAFAALVAVQVAAVYHGMVEQELVMQLQAANKQLHAWTVNTPEALKAVLDVGVDGIVTNHPSAAREAIDSRLVKCLNREEM